MLRRRCKLASHNGSGSPFSFDWNTTGVTKGTHTLIAVATDVAGNSTTSAAISVTIK